MILPSNETCVCTLPPAGRTRFAAPPSSRHQSLTTLNVALGLGLTEHVDSGLARQPASCRLAFAAVHEAVVHLHAVDAQGAVREQLEAGVLEGGKENE